MSTALRIAASILSADRVHLDDEQRAQVESFLSELDDHDDVQHFYSAID